MYFTNHVDGYRLMVQSSMQVDMRYAGVRTVLSNPGYTIEIYDQPLGSGLSYASYRTYGNLFLKDYPFYTVLYQGTMTFAGHSAHVLEWTRPALRNIPDDKTYYACVDLRVSSARALTFLFKSNRPFDQFDSKYYVLVLNTLTLEPKTAHAVNRRTEIVPNPHWNEETSTFFSTYLSSWSPLTWGLYEPGAPLYDVPRLHQIEDTVRHKFRVLLEYSSIADCNLEEIRTTLANAARDGRTVELTLQTEVLDDRNVLMDVLDGQYDDFLNRYAKIVAESRQPVLFRLCNEMNGDWCIYSAYHTSKDTALYQAFYRYVHSVFEKNGALANTIWVWNPNERSYPNFKWNHALCYYPGDDLVDVVGLTGYNNGTFYKGETWRSFPEIYDALYREYDAQYAQPLMITEFSCSSIGGDKAAWVREMLENIPRYDRIKIAVWWDSCDYTASKTISRPYFIDDVPGVTDAFRSNFAH